MGDTAQEHRPDTRQPARAEHHRTGLDAVGLGEDRFGDRCVPSARTRSRLQTGGAGQPDAFLSALAGAVLVVSVDLFHVRHVGHQAAKAGAGADQYVSKRLPYPQHRGRLATEELAGAGDRELGIPGTVVVDQDHAACSSGRSESLEPMVSGSAMPGAASTNSPNVRLCAMVPARARRNGGTPRAPADGRW